MKEFDRETIENMLFGTMAPIRHLAPDYDYATLSTELAEELRPQYLEHGRFGWKRKKYE